MVMWRSRARIVGRAACQTCRYDRCSCTLSTSSWHSQVSKHNAFRARTIAVIPMTMEWSDDVQGQKMPPVECFTRCDGKVGSVLRQRALHDRELPGTGLGRGGFQVSVG